MAFTRAIRLAAFTAVALGCDAATPRSSDAPVYADAGEVAFELAGPNDAAVVVPVTVNGRGPFRLVLDTGATLTCFDQSVVDSLALPEQAGIGVGAGVGGSGRIALVQVDSLSVGAAAARGLTACVLDLAELQQLGLDVHGLLGLNFLKEFRVALDFERQVLVLTAR